MSEHSWNVLKLVGATVVAGAAVWFAVEGYHRFSRAGESGAAVWFYDPHTQQLYRASRDTIPPDSRNHEGVRAMVVSFRGQEPQTPRIAYLETYGPPLKAALERVKLAQASGKALNEPPPERNSEFFRTNDLVRRVEEPEWHPAGSPAGRKIMEEWKQWRSADGREPMVCMP